MELPVKNLVRKPPGNYGQSRYLLTNKATEPYIFFQDSLYKSC